MEILIIKLGADGDVIRTIPLAKAIKKAHSGATLHWLTKGDVSSLLNNIPCIDRVHVVPFASDIKYDILYNFDIEPAATERAQTISAKKKYGFYSEGNYPAPFNQGAQYYLNTVFDDALKKSNTRTYQDMMFELTELPTSTERYELILTDEDKAYAQAYKEKYNIDSGKIIGIHMGASSRWPSKVWHESELKRFAQIISKKGYDILLFGGPNETKTHPALVQELQNLGVKVFQNNPYNTKREFIALLSLCSWVVCSDSLALHVAVGLGKKTTCLFFCTSSNEVETYGLVSKIVSPLRDNFFPERSNEYNEELVKSITAEEIVASIRL